MPNAPDIAQAGSRLDVKRASRRGAFRAGSRNFRRVFDTVSIRMIFIILMSSVPLAVLSTLLSWHNYERASEYSNVRALSFVSVFQARAQQDLLHADNLLQGVAGLAALRSPDTCQNLLHVALAMQGPQYESLSLMDRVGHVVCASGSPWPSTSQRPMQPRPGFDRVTVRDGPDGGKMLVADLVSQELQGAVPGQPMFLVAALRLGWKQNELFGDTSHGGILASDIPVHAWLTSRDGQVAPLCQDCGWIEPANLVALRRQTIAGARTMLDSTWVTAKDAPGSSAAIGVLVGPVDVLAITSSTSEELRALSVFIMRVIGIVLLVGFGLMAVSVGANMLVVAPLQGLTGAVNHWRRAGGYDPHRIRMMPVELRDLSRAFTQATKSLGLHEQTLREAEARQELLIKEIHHRVKNNLQIIASLLNLQANRIRQPEARAEFASARDRVRALATLHRYLYTEGELQTLNMRSFLQELCAQLFQAIGEPQGRRIQLHIEAPEIEMATDQAVPLSLIVTEAVSNAIKYAFPGGRSGHVRVTLSELPNGMARLMIQDDGVGIPAGRAETETGIRDGLGIQLIRGFARQLGAQLDVHEGDGTRYMVTFPLHPRKPDSSTDDGDDGETADEDDDAGER